MSDRGAFLSVLDWLNRPSQAILNGLQGRWESAGRQLAQMGVDTVDAVLPGDWLPNDIARPQDQTSTSEALGIDKNEHPWLGFGADVAGGLITDPLTYIPGGLVAKGIGKLASGTGKLAKAAVVAAAGAEAGEKVNDAAGAIGRGVRRTFGAERLSPDVQAIIQKANNAKLTETTAGAEAIKASAVAKLSPEERAIVADVMQNIRTEGGKPVGAVSDAATALERLPSHPGVTPENIGRLQAAISDASEIGRNSKAYPGIFRAPADQGIPVYHASPGDIEGDFRVGAQSFNDEPAGVYFSRSRDEALRATGKPNAKVSQWDLYPKKVLDDEDELQRLYQEALNESAQKTGVSDPDALRAIQSALGEDANASHLLRQKLIERGYDMVRKKPIGGSVDAADHIALDTNIISKRGAKAADDLLPDDYLMRKYSGQTEEQQVNAALGRMPEGMTGASSTKGIKLEGPEDVASYLEKNPKVTFERDAAKLLAARAEQQGTLASRAEVGKALVGDSFAYADSDMRRLAQDTIENMARTDPESARALSDVFNGVEPRGKLTSFLAGAMKPFKQAAVYGVIIPKLGSINRNAISGIWQAFANPESRATALNAAKNLDGTLIGSISDAMGLQYPRDRLKGVIDDVQAAFAGSKGASSNAVKALRAAGKEDAASVIESGVLDGFVRTDDITKAMARSPWQQKFANAWNWPATMFKGVEDRMRIGMFLDLMKNQGKTAQEAARITGDSLYRYGSTSLENRTARDLIPFFQFQAKAIPQSAKLLAEKPWLATGMAAAFHEDPNQPIYPYMEGKLNIPLGPGTNGDQQYLTGLGLPFESLGSIPNFSASAGDLGRELRQNVVGNANPVLKATASLTMGMDPYFETPYGSYEKMPVFGEAGGAGRLYNEWAQTGVLQPIDSVLRSINSVTDPRETPGVKALDVLTGAKIANVDEDNALQQQLEQQLKANPQVRQYRTFYQGGERDQATEDVIDQYHAAKARIKAKRAGISFP